MTNTIRPGLAVVGIATLGLAALAYWGLESETTAGIALRSSFLLGALWLGWPEITQRSPRTILLVVAATLVLFLRPRAAWVMIPALLVWAGMRKT